MERKKYTNPEYYRPGTSGSKETKQDYGQQGTMTITIKQKAKWSKWKSVFQTIKYSW